MLPCILRHLLKLHCTIGRPCARIRHNLTATSAAWVVCLRASESSVPFSLSRQGICIASAIENSPASYFPFGDHHCFSKKIQPALHQFSRKTLVALITIGPHIRSPSFFVLLKALSISVRQSAASSLCFPDRQDSARACRCFLLPVPSWLCERRCLLLLISPVRPKLCGKPKPNDAPAAHSWSAECLSNGRKRAATGDSVAFRNAWIQIVCTLSRITAVLCFAAELCKKRTRRRLQLPLLCVHLFYFVFNSPCSDASFKSSA